MHSATDPRSSWQSLLLVPVLLLLAGCQDALFVEPASQEARLALSYAVSGGVASDPGPAFDHADRVRVTVTGPEVALDTVVAFAPAGETRVRIRVPGVVDGQLYTVQVELLAADQVLYTATMQVPLQAGVTAEAAVSLEPVPPMDAAVCAADTGNPWTFTDLTEAVAMAAPGATLSMCAGSYPINELVIDKPLTLEGAGSTTFITAGSGGVAHVLVQHTTGSVVVRSMEFPEAGGVFTAGDHGSLTVENVTFRDPVREAVFVGSTNIQGATATIRGITVVGGVMGVFVAGGRADVTDSRFEGQLFANVQYLQGASGTVANNTMEECGQRGCVRAPDAAALVVADNHVRTTRRAAAFTGGVHYGIYVSGPNIQVEGNTVEGVSDGTSFRPIAGAGIQIVNNTVGPTNVVVRGNTISNVNAGIESATIEGVGQAAHADIFDNIVGDVNVGVIKWNAGTVQGDHNDFQDFATAATHVDDAGGTQGFSAGDLACNWWGSASGPSNPGSPLSNVYTPFADAPIAGTGRACPTGSPPSVAITSVAAGSSLPQGWDLFLRAAAADAAGADLSSAVEWTSSLDGALGTGSGVSAASLNPGNHSITAAVVDGQGRAASASVPLVIRAPVSIPVTSTERIFAFDLTGMSAGPPFQSIAYRATFAPSDPVAPSDTLIVTIYGDAAAANLLQVRHETGLPDGGTRYGPAETANALFDPMLDGEFAIGFHIPDGPATLTSLVVCGIAPGGQLFSCEAIH